MNKQPIIARKGPLKGHVHRIGHGWPSWSRQWCTRIKANTIDRFVKDQHFVDPIRCIGFAADEVRRAERANFLKKDFRFPLIEWGITEQDALEYCKSLGYTWSGLYDVFHRVSCFRIQGRERGRMTGACVSFKGQSVTQRAESVTQRATYTKLQQRKSNRMRDLGRRRKSPFEILSIRQGGALGLTPAPARREKREGGSKVK